MAKNNSLAKNREANRLLQTTRKSHRFNGDLTEKNLWVKTWKLNGFLRNNLRNGLKIVSIKMIPAKRRQRSEFASRHKGFQEARLIPKARVTKESWTRFEIVRLSSTYGVPQIHEVSKKYVKPLTRVPQSLCEGKHEN